jgi:DNA (cytosine-5)-methyltransferase 1
MKINVVTLCSGYDSQCLGLERLKADYPDFDYELLAWSEIDPYAIKAHNALFPQWADRNLGDMTCCDYSTIIQPVDLLFYSTPCQSLSICGKREGMKEGSDAASALIWSTRRAIETLCPKYLILENVKGILNKLNADDFRSWCSMLERLGYANFYKVLSPTDYNVPQTRQRLFMVSILNDSGVMPTFDFPEPIALTKTIGDILEDTPDDRYYLTQKQLARIKAHCDRKVAEGCGFKLHIIDRGG